MSNQPHRYRIVLDYIEPWLDEQDESTLRQIYADLLVLEKEGPSLGRPLVDRVKGSKLHHLKELRVTSCGPSVIRILLPLTPSVRQCCCWREISRRRSRRRQSGTAGMRSAFPGRNKYTVAM